MNSFNSLFLASLVVLGGNAKGRIFQDYVQINCTGLRGFIQFSYLRGIKVNIIQGNVGNAVVNKFTIL